MTSPAEAPSNMENLVRDDDGDLRPEFVASVSAEIGRADPQALRRLVNDLHEADLGALLEALEADDRPRLIELMGSDFDFTALTEVDDSVREDILDELEPETVAEGMRELDTDDAVYILEDMDEADKAEILGKMPALERIILQKSLDYPEGSAGRRMQSETVAVPEFWTVGQAIDFLRDAQDLPERFYEIFVVDADKRLMGTVQLDRLLTAKRPVRLQTLVDEDPRTVEATDDLEDVARLFQRYNLVAAPVVDDTNHLVGVMTIDDIVDIIEEAADEDLKQLGGVAGDEELSDRVPDIARGRFRWLLVNLMTAFLAAAVMKLFEAGIEKMVALAVLAPVVASQGGNAATQTMTVAVRALATRELTVANTRRFFNREIIVALINGLAFALITGLLAALWFAVPGLGLVIGLAMIVNLIAGAFAGVAIPVILDRLEIDPAVSSGTFVTTVTDVVGFFAFLGIATVWFGLD